MSQKPPPKQFVKSPIKGTKSAIMVSSAKGGVGKSTVAINLAFALQHLGLKIGILDADVYGPSLPKLLNLNEKPKSEDNKTIMPLEKFGVQCMSMGILIDEQTPMMWRGPMVISAIKTMTQKVLWKERDIILIDMPPGTGDAYLTIANEVNPDGIILVTTNNIMSAEDTLKSKITFNKLEIPILGFLINMYENSKGKYKMSAKELQNLLDVNCFGTIYFDNNLAEFKSQTITKVFKPIIELI